MEEKNTRKPEERQSTFNNLKKQQGLCAEEGRMIVENVGH